MRTNTSLSLLLVVASHGCQWIWDIEELPREQTEVKDSAVGSSGQGSSAPRDCADPTVPTVRGGPDMVQVQRPDGSCFWIDDSEVTRGQYAEFLHADPAPLTDAECAWNDRFTDAACDDPANPMRVTMSLEPDHPVVCVDECDAVAFCIWAGKELCAGGADGIVDADDDQWYAACAGPRGASYPYGTRRNVGRCNGIDNPDTGCLPPGTCSTVTADDLIGCVSEAGARHLSGNVEEWTAACDGSTGASNRCRVRGGSAGSDSAQLSCETATRAARNYTSPLLGFRCCMGGAERTP